MIRGLALAIVLTACRAPGHHTEWSLRFADPADRERSQLVEALVLEGGCDGRPVYRAEVPAGGLGPTPPVLTPGRYGLAGLARDGACATIARGCVAVALPLPDQARVVVPLARVDEGAACPASACRAGRCEGANELDGGFEPIDGGVEIPDAGRGDAGPPDAGLPDAGLPDANLPDANLPDASSPCDLYRDGRCFRLVPTPDTWDAAERACVVWGGHLVAYDDAEEEAAVEGQLGDGHWIGLSDAAREGTFVWADGTALGYARWSPGAPASTPPWRDCVRHTASGWLDARCNELRPFVCER